MFLLLFLQIFLIFLCSWKSNKKKQHLICLYLFHSWWKNLTVSNFMEEYFHCCGKRYTKSWQVNRRWTETSLFFFFFMESEARWSNAISRRYLQTVWGFLFQSKYIRTKQNEKRENGISIFKNTYKSIKIQERNYNKLMIFVGGEDVCDFITKKKILKRKRDKYRLREISMQ